MIDLTGETFGRVTVIGEVERVTQPNGAKVRVWKCVCSCSPQKEFTVRQNALREGGIQSCGCIRTEKLVAHKTSHGLRDTRQYSIWANMRARCNNPNNKSYPDYGGRGITCDPRWETFSAFWEDMGEGYDDHLTLERTDNNLGYYKGNCKWIEKSRQARNRGFRGDNTSGVTGVSFRGTNDSPCWSAQWMSLEGKVKSKSYSINKYGDELAFFLACEYRQQQIDLLNLMGAGYTEDHGK